jgi:inositol-1,4,5-trisphosphate 5-phosphatase
MQIVKLNTDNLKNLNFRRRPSWTDRILYKVNANVYENLTLQAEQISYRSVEEYVQSDHKPVVGEFIIKVHKHLQMYLYRRITVSHWYTLESEVSLSCVGTTVLCKLKEIRTFILLCFSVKLI